MKDIHNYFAGKKITVMGLGLLGRGVGDATFLAECGAEVTVTDLKSEEELRESVEKIKHFPNVRLVLGGHDEKDFENVDMVLVAAGVPLDSPYVAHARAAGVRLVQSAALLAELCDRPVIGVTGTRGKSTVAHLIHHTLNQAGNEALLGGNVRGVSNLQLLNKLEDSELVVLELDSWQLQGFGWAKISPNIAVFTNLHEDHLNYYPDMDTYFLDKANIYKYQSKGDTFIAGSSLMETNWFSLCEPRVEPIEPEPIPGDWWLHLPGEHNRENAALAAAALRAYGVNEEAIRRGIESFTGVEGRLQFVCENRDVQIYNDNNATTPQATYVALQALGRGDKRIILIAGGSDKGLDLASLMYAITQHCRHVVLTPGTGTDRLKEMLDGAPIKVTIVDSMEVAVNTARDLAAPGDTILFSPAFASFGQYNNEYERNDAFMNLVGALGS